MLRNESARAHLVAHQLDLFGFRADEDHAGRLDRAGKAGVLRQEAVARMDGARAANFAAAMICARRDRPRPVSPRRFRSRDRPRHRRRAAIGGVIDDDAFEAQRLHGAQDAQRDLAAIGDQDGTKGPVRCEHGLHGIPLSGL